MQNRLAFNLHPCYVIYYNWQTLFTSTGMSDSTRTFPMSSIIHPQMTRENVTMVYQILIQNYTWEKERYSLVQDRLVQVIKLSTTQTPFFALSTPSGEYLKPFWGLCVVQSNPQHQGRPAKLLVNWYDLQKDSSIYTGHFKPLLLNQKKGKSAPWIVKVDVDYDFISFPAPILSKTLLATVSRDMKNLSPEPRLSYSSNIYIYILNIHFDSVLEQSVCDLSHHPVLPSKCQR